MFSTDFRKKGSNIKIHKTRKVGAELPLADGRMDRQTDIMKLKFASRSFASASIDLCPI
jgi:hypothetical protein